MLLSDCINKAVCLEETEPQTGPAAHKRAFNYRACSELLLCTDTRGSLLKWSTNEARAAFSTRSVRPHSWEERERSAYTNSPRLFASLRQAARNVCLSAVNKTFISAASEQLQMPSIRLNDWGGKGGGVHGKALIYDRAHAHQLYS